MRKFILALKYLGLYYVSYTLILFAVSKFLGHQFRVKNFVEYTPLTDLSSMQLAWAYFGHSYHYNLFLGIIELIAASLILFQRTRLAGLLLALGMYTNIVLIDFEFEVDAAIQHATIEFIIVLIWLLPYLNDLKKYLWDMGGKFVNNETYKNKILSIYLPVGFIILSSVYALNSRSAGFVPTDKIIGAYKILELSVNGEKLELGQGKYTKKPMLFFEFSNGFVLSVNDSSYYGNYEIKADSIFVSFDQGFRNIKSLKATINNDESVIKGLTNNRQPFEISIEKIRKENQN
ncbi:MAG: hypothetical protein ABI723_27115 [Bacteroidia bacterium]